MGLYSIVEIIHSNTTIMYIFKPNSNHFLAFPFRLFFKSLSCATRLILSDFLLHASQRSLRFHSRTLIPSSSGALPISQFASRKAYPPLIVTPFIPTVEIPLLALTTSIFSGSVRGATYMPSRRTLGALGGDGKRWSFSNATPMYWRSEWRMGSR